MGAAGDMLTAALYELLPDKQCFLEKMNNLGLPGVSVAAERLEKCGIVGTHMKVTVNGEEEPAEEAEHYIAAGHVHLPDIGTLLDSLAVPDRVRANAKAVYKLIADAESEVHGQSVNEIHFHEVGAMDAIADVVGVCLLLEMIAPDEIFASPVHVGSGFVRCAHGLLPVPAPATALLLKGIPICGGQVQGELCTPTGAALLKHFVTRFGDRPVMSTDAIGVGLGKRDFEQANCLRAFLGKREGRREKITMLECNVDDMTGEDIGFATEMLFKAGAREVFTQPVGMKKSRPGVLITAICLPEKADELAAVMIKHTTTLGVRRQDLSRYVLKRKTETVETPYGPVRVKVSSGMGVERRKAEYDDLAAIAGRNELSLQVVRKEIEAGR